MVYFQEEIAALTADGSLVFDRQNEKKQTCLADYDGTHPAENAMDTDNRVPSH